MADPNNKDDQRPDRKNGDDGSPQGPDNRPPQPFISRNLILGLMVAVLVIVAFLVFNNSNAGQQEVSMTQFLEFAREGWFKGEVVVQADRMSGELDADKATGRPKTPGNGKDYVWTGLTLATQEIAFERLDGMGTPFKIRPSDTFLPQLISTWLPFFLILFLVWFFIFRGLRSAGGGAGMLGNFGRSRHKVINKEHSTITLNDVAGIQEAKEEVVEIIEFLKNPKKFQRLGGRVPRGVLLEGRPGCGKTLLAKAVAGEAEVPFFSISGSDFVEMFVGVGASRVRDLFKQAKDSSPCIIFLDEIDAVGRRRGNGNVTGGHDEREQTLNAILVEMDGFESNDQVIVIAATNRVDVLDPALTRPGRFDRQIQVPLPDVRGRVEILKVHSRRVKMSPDIDLERLARGTPMFSGADLAAVINEAAIAATLHGKDFVEQDDLEEARDKVRFGRSHRSRKIEEKERVSTAYHEAGHALLQYLLDDADPLHKVTIIPRGMAMGATFSLPEKDRYGYGRAFIAATMRVLCGGRIAEEKKTGDVTSGAAMDIRMGTAYARHMILEWGMSEKLGFVDYTNPEERESMFAEKSYSEETARLIDGEVKRLIDEAYQDARRIIEENWDKVIAIAEALLRYETLSLDEIDRLMKGEQLTKPTIGDLLKAEAAKSQDASRPAVKPQDKPREGDDPTPMPSPA